MSENVIDIRDRLKPKAAEPKWAFDLRIWSTPGGPEALITDFNDQDGHEAADRLRVFAGMLDQLHYYMMQQAHMMEPNDDGQILAKLAVFESSRVRLRINDDRVQTVEQEDWLRERFEDAKSSVAGKK
ncbi:hypothetical protein [Aureimonas pseudogalii]|uniref:Uncharacterized protein n=1 Tax=Aureimonas pseudogalii TaxID=1744844 RepID=A0A7W6EFB9_9HYPH|nr:hypothetical protein [Aureimonas pseudogalii]MBB3997213.1 hypothetical protein [Aureimonas pseudogalii]